MKLDFDKTKLNKVLETFNTVTKANVCVFDSDFTPIASYGYFPCFCEEIRKREDLYQCCLLSDKKYAEECSKKRDGVTYTCHAGIVETISPIFSSGMLLGYVIFGGLRDSENVYSSRDSVRKACKGYGLSEEKFLRLYGEIPEFDHKQLDAYVQILKLCIKNILTENMLKPNSTLFSSRIMSFLKDNFTSDIKVKDVCLKFGITEKTLYKIVRGQVKLTVNGYLTALRIEKAKELLKATDKSVAEVACLVGFNDYNYFIRVFKKTVGTTPLSYKKPDRRTE